MAESLKPLHDDNQNPPGSRRCGRRIAARDYRKRVRFMTTPLYWIDGPWPGKLAIAPRPRGGDWLAEELDSWRALGISGVVSTLTDHEATELNLTGEADECVRSGLWFSQFPIDDRDVPKSRTDALAASREWDERLRNGESVAIHCRQGVGRSALMAALLLTTEGVSPSEAWRRIEAARKTPVPDTAEQKAWVERVIAAVHLT